MFYYELINDECKISQCDTPKFEISYDLVVAGLGSAGSFLALTAAEEGFSVLGLERGTCCGGMSVQGAVNGYYNGYKGGRFEDIDKTTANKISAIYRNFYNHPDAKKIRIEQELLNSDVKIKYHSVIIGIYADNNEIFGVRLSENNTIYDVGCKFLSDSTSEGFVLRILGILGRYGRPTDGATAPFSSVRIYRHLSRSLARTNDDSGYINPYNDADFTKSVITAHGKHLADSIPGKERFLYVAPLIGNREGMTIIGEQTVTLNDIVDAKEWDNTLLCAYSDVDKHGTDHAFDSKEFQDWFVISNLSTITFKIRIPLGAIVPKDWKRLIAVSRCIGVDSYASSAVRMNRDMYRLGEASGIAVALALKNNLNSVLSVDYSELNRRVINRNCYDSSPNNNMGFVDFKAEKPYVEIQWLTDFDEIKKALATDCPGVAIWSCKKLGAENIADKLNQLLESENTNVRFNAAIILGLLEDTRAINMLREIVQNRCEYHYLDCRRSNQMRSVIAICLLGRFGDTGILNELYQILEPDEFDKKMYHTYIETNYKFSIVPNLNSVYYQHFSFTVAALVEIAKKHPSYASEIKKALLSAVTDESYIKRMTNDPVGSSYYVMAKDIKKFIYKHI